MGGRIYRKAVIVSRLVPWPSDTGALLYSEMLVRRIAAFAHETLLVVGNHPRGIAPAPAPIKLRSEPAGKASALRYLRSGLPFAALPFNTAALRRHATEAMADADLVVLDHIGSAWALDLALAAKARSARLVYVAHNVESDTRRSAIASGGLRALFARFDALRIERVEGQLLCRADAVICISSDDSSRFAEMGAEADLVVINPVYPGDARIIDAGFVAARRVVLVGSFHWRAKQENLWRFLAAREADPVAKGIKLRVVGTMPEEFRARVQKLFPDIEVTGTVKQIGDHLVDCRIGVIPEDEGGGFKLKALDYAYAGLPIFGLENGVRGLPLRDGVSMKVFPTMAGLWHGIVDAIDKPTQLEGLRHEALSVFERNAETGHTNEQLIRAINGQSDA